MPRYGFHCQNCGKKFRKFLTYQEYGSVEVLCPYCQSASLKRLIDKVRFAKSEDSRMESLESTFSNPAALEGLENDPVSMGRLMRQMGNEMGEELGPEFDEVVKRLEKGQSPEEIEKEMPDLGEGMGEMGMPGMGGMGMPGGGYDDIDDF
ncbi:MAG TPA: FmdB family zinc ribbon protein [Anaerolineales bacterium]|nr:FmdB family zinc ribbon protein [Anaerolineales bacterium]